MPTLHKYTTGVAVPTLQPHTHYTTSFLTYLLTLFTPCSRVLLEKLTGLQLVKKFPAFYGTRRFITAVTSARHLSLSWASSIQSINPHPAFSRSILILCKLKICFVLCNTYMYVYVCSVLSSQIPLGFPSDFPAKSVLTFVASPIPSLYTIQVQYIHRNTKISKYSKANKIQ